MWSATAASRSDVGTETPTARPLIWTVVWDTSRATVAATGAPAFRLLIIAESAAASTQTVRHAPSSLSDGPHGTAELGTQLVIAGGNDDSHPFAHQILQIQPRAHDQMLSAGRTAWGRNR